MAAPISAASANVTEIRDIYTLSGGSMGGTFGGVTASGDFGVDYYSNGKDYLFADVTASENIGGTTYTYNFNYKCYSLSPGCNSQLEQPSQLDASFDAVLTVDTYAYSGNPSTVPISFSDFIYVYSGSGTLNYEVVRTSATPLPLTLPLFTTGLGALGLLGWRRKRKSGAAIAV